MRAFDAIWCLDTRSFHSVNDAFMTLIPKSIELVAVKEFRPISLIHIVGKLFSKVLGARLAPNLVTLVHPSQSAFKVIHDNFKYVQSSAKLLHSRRLTTLLLKVDIARAFDSVA
jgi:hypothetical protein